MKSCSISRFATWAAIFATTVGPTGPAFAENPVQMAASAGGLLETCFLGSSQFTRPDAEQRADVCSQALQLHGLTPAQVALARFNRGIARMAMGDRVLATGDYQEALRHYDNVIDSNAPDALALYRRGVILDGLGQTDRALSDFNEAIRLAPDEPRAFFERGVLLASRRRRAYDRAISDFDRALELAPNNLPALVRRGDAYGKIGDFGRALADLDRAVQIAPYNAQARVLRGLANGRRGENALAMRDYNIALNLDPTDVDALVNRAAIYAVDGEQDLALADLTAAIAIERHNPLAFYNRGYVHFAKHEYDLAIADYSAAIRLDADMGLAFNNRCLTRTIVGKDLVAALEDCDTALKMMPTNLDVRVTRGFIYLKLGEPAIAITEYNAVLAIDANRALALHGRGLAHRKLGHEKEGEADQAAARALNPGIERQFSMYDVI